MADAAESTEVTETPGPVVKFPPEIVVSDDDPSSGSFTLKITIPELEVKFKGILKKEVEVTNGSCEVTIEEREISIEAELVKNGKTIKYGYRKKIPEDLKINTKSSKYKYDAQKGKDPKVLFILAKADKKMSLGSYEDYFRKKK